jgi:hypothetical protein
MGVAAYCEMLEIRIVELLMELDDDQERRAMMRELQSAAVDAGIYTSPAPDPENPRQWAVDLISGDPAMKSVIMNRRAFEWMPHPSSFENLDEIASALRPTHSPD